MGGWAGIRSANITKGSGVALETTRERGEGERSGTREGWRKSGSRLALMMGRPGPHMYSCLPSQLQQCQISTIKPSVLDCAHRNSWLARAKKRNNKRMVKRSDLKIVEFLEHRRSGRLALFQRGASSHGHLKTSSKRCFRQITAFIGFPEADVSVCPEHTESHIRSLCPPPRLCVFRPGGLVKRM